MAGVLEATRNNKRYKILLLYPIVERIRCHFFSFLPCLPMLTYVNQCLLVFTYVYHVPRSCLPILPIFTFAYLWLNLFTYVYPCCLVFTYVYSCLPVCHRLLVFTYVYNCLLVHVSLCSTLSMDTWQSYFEL